VVKPRADRHLRVAVIISGLPQIITRERTGSIGSAT
jgi:hypothetical protein